ncbi:hypothetical protein Lal_00025100 [Lupinus albus]|nr:hypothetical protein Lal_00025100 [Lupinus albus]
MDFMGINFKNVQLSTLKMNAFVQFFSMIQDQSDNCESGTFHNFFGTTAIFDFFIRKTSKEHYSTDDPNYQSEFLILSQLEVQLNLMLSTFLSCGYVFHGLI